MKNPYYIAEEEKIPAPKKIYLEDIRVNVNDPNGMSSSGLTPRSVEDMYYEKQVPVFLQ